MRTTEQTLNGTEIDKRHQLCTENRDHIFEGEKKVPFSIPVNSVASV